MVAVALAHAQGPDGHDDEDHADDGEGDDRGIKQGPVLGDDAFEHGGGVLVTGGGAGAAMGVRIQNGWRRGLVFHDLAVGADFLDVGDEGDDLGLSKVVAQGVSLQLGVIRQIDLGGDE